MRRLLSARPCCLWGTLPSRKFAVGAGALSVREQQEADFKPSWGEGPPSLETEEAPAELLDLMFPKKKKRAKYPLEKYPLDKRFRREQYGNLVEQSQFALIFRHDLSTKAFADWQMKVSQKSDSRVRFKSAVKNSLFRVAVEKEHQGKWASLSPLFQSQTCILFQNDMEHALEDYRLVLKSKPKGDVVTMLGGKFQDSVLDFESIPELGKINSIADLHYQIIGILSTPGNALIRTLNHSSNSLIRTLDFKVKQGEEANDS
jgi:ribosomal protein L10